MNILLIHPYITTITREIVLTEPFGLMSLATYIEDVLGDSVNVSILDLYALGCDKPRHKGDMYVYGVNDENVIKTYLKTYSPDFVGIHCNFTGYCDDAYEIAAIVKRVLPEVPVTLGGAHVTMEAKTVLKENPYIDYVVRGEGEITLKELICMLMNGKEAEPEKIDGLSYRKIDGTVVMNPERKLIPDINQLPTPDRKFVDMERYMELNNRALPFTKKKPLGIIMTSRGCPFNCIFCSTKMMWKRQWRALSAERVIEDIEYMVKNFGVREIIIYDDQFIVDKKRVHRICDLIIEKKLNITLSLPAGTSAWLLDKALLRKMKKAGFYRLCFPIETGNENTIKFIRKNINLNEVLKKIRLANKLGFWTQGNFIIGFPYETREEIEETIRFAYNSGLDYVVFYIAKPYAGSEMYEIYKKEGLLTKVGPCSDILVSDCDTKTMKASELNKIYSRAVKGYLPYKFVWYF
ncbi:radical SAM protein, partial [Candidatus Pacearchaeota archaeon]|nr:radical SAM protein [Candidatus Pacearchaeota archaeon]